MHAPSDSIRNGLSALSQKLVPEVLVSGLAIVLVMALFANVMKVVPPSSRADRPGSDGLLAETSGEATADFMQRVALSHVGGAKQNPAAPATSAEANAAPTNAAAAPLPQVTAAAPKHAKPHVAMVRVAASAPTVLPPPRPPLATIAPAVVSDPPKSKLVRPLRDGIHLVSQIVDFVPASGTRVFEGMTSIGGALASLVKKL